MRIITFILFLLFLSESIQEYQLSIDIFFSGELKFDLILYNNKDINKFHSGSIENIDKILYKKNKKTSKDEIAVKSGSHPLVNIYETNYIEYINLFPKKTIFLVQEQNNRRLDLYTNYTIFMVSDNDFYQNNIHDYINQKYFYYAKIGKKLDIGTENTLNFFLFANIFISLLTAFIFRKILKKTADINKLPVHFLISSLADLLFITNFIGGLSYLLFNGSDFYFLTEFSKIFLYAFYKSIYYSTIIMILSGWQTIFFLGLGQRFKKINKRIMLYDSLFSIIIILSIYFIRITSKLNLFYIKNLSEHIILLGITIFRIIKTVIPLGKQMNYEQRIRSNLVKCIKNKFKKVLFTAIFTIIYTIFFIISPIFEHKFLYSYIDNFNIHLIFQFFYENIFIVIFIIIYFPRKLPRYYLDEVYINYKTQVHLRANISEKENERLKNKKFSISNLKFDILKKFSKKDNFPIVLINPFTSSKKNSLFNELHIGFVQRYKKEK